MNDEPVMPEPVTTEPMTTKPEALDTHVSHHSACIQCGYDLMGTELTGTCPECGEPVARSVNGDLLVAADPQWVSRLAKGMLYTGIGSILGILIACLAGIAGGVIGGVSAAQAGSQGTAQVDHNIHIASIASAAVGLIPAAVALYGIWLFTTPEAERSLSDVGRRKTSRMFARVALVMSAIFTVVNVGIVIASPMISQVFGLIGTLFGLVLTIALLLYATSIARRIPSKKMAMQTMIVMWGLVGGVIGYAVGAAVVAALVFAFVMPNMGSGAQPPVGAMIGMGVGSVVVFIAGLAMVVFGIWAIVLMFWYHSKLSALVKPEPAM